LRGTWHALACSWRHGPCVSRTQRARQASTWRRATGKRPSTMRQRLTRTTPARYCWPPIATGMRRRASLVLAFGAPSEGVHEPRLPYRFGTNDASLCTSCRQEDRQVRHLTRIRRHYGRAEQERAGRRRVQARGSGRERHRQGAAQASLEPLNPTAIHYFDRTTALADPKFFTALYHASHPALYLARCASRRDASSLHMLRHCRGFVSQ
jgi:hypothetical protein